MASIIAQPQPRRKTPVDDASVVPADWLYRLSVEQYHEMLTAGVLWHGAPVELIEGLLLENRQGHLRRSDPVWEGRQIPVFRLSVDDYHTMRDACILTEESCVELLEGMLIEKMVRRPPHDTALGLLQDALTELCPAEWFLRVQSALRLTDGEPEPDLALIRGERRRFSQRHPTARDCGLVIEVADSSLPLDRGLKLQTYAKHAIVEYWIVNLIDERIEVYRQPSGLTDEPTYERRQDFSRGESVPLTLDGDQFGTISVVDVIP